MKAKIDLFSKLLALTLYLQVLNTSAAVHYVSANATNGVPPYSDWATAAQTIQDAIDVSSAGDLVLVTNGIYATGGRLMGGTLTNRVILDKVLTVQSVNGPLVTAIEGVNGMNGYGQARCVWMTSGAVLSGFTVRAGRTMSGGIQADVNGGGIWGTFTSARVTNCIITGNFGYSRGGGASQVSLINCTISANRSGEFGGLGMGGGADSCNLTNCIITQNTSGRGGGTYNCTLRNCAVTKNTGSSQNGGSEGGQLINCTVTGNFASAGGGVGSANLINCIVYSNRGVSGSSSNYSGSTFTYSCTSPLPTGTGNFDADPQLISDGIHLTSGSPCRGTGTSLTGTSPDIDGQPWATPRSIGCDEWVAAPGMTGPLRIDLFRKPLTLSLRTVAVAGQEPFVFSWIKDGTLLANDSHYDSTDTTNLVIRDFGPGHAGNYILMASNVFGVSSAAVQIVTHCVDVGGTAPLAPYADWQTAATNIQDAVDAATYGEFVLVTNGLYANGGRVMVDDLTNRIMVTKSVIVASINGSDSTIIQGNFDPVSTNGPLAVRCAWLADGATLDGFTLQNGATRNSGDSFWLQGGGGVWGTSSNAIVINCVITNNAAAYAAGGCFQVFVMNSKVLGNRCGQQGGGAHQCSLVNSLIQGNSSQYGGGTYNSAMTNCTVTSNTAQVNGGGMYSGVAVNSIVFNNFANFFPFQPNYTTGPPTTFINSCTSPIPSSGPNISADPQLLNGAWLSLTSPCRGAGNALYATGKDIDGEAWANPPSMGCDELWESAVTGPLAVGVTANSPVVVENKTLFLFGLVTGRATHVDWSFGDGAVITNASYTFIGHIWTNSGDYTVTFTAYNADYPAGVSTNVVLHVVPLAPPTITVGGLNGTNFSLSFPGQPGASYVVEQTSDLTPPVVWKTVASVNANNTNLLQVTDTKATNASRFYRVRAQ